MVSDATKKFREIFAYGLLGVAALYFISGLALLFKSSDDLGGAGFADKAALFGYVFTHPVLVIALFGAVTLVTSWGENSKNAKTIVMVALGIAAASLLFGLICWLAAFGAESSGSGFGIFNGIFGAGKIVGIFLGLAQLGLLGLLGFATFTVFQTFPKAVPAQQGQWGQHGQGQQAGWGQQPQQGGWDQQHGQQAQPGGWGQQDQGTGQQAWGQQDQGSSQQWGAAGTGAAAGTAWGEQSGTQADQQGQPASSWSQDPQAGQQTDWGQSAPATDPSQQSWGTTPDATTPPPPAQDETQVWSGQTGTTGQESGNHAGQPDPADQVAPASDDENKDENPPQQGWWQPNQ